MAGEGLWTTWRELKPGTLDAVADGLAPLRWCMFVEPLHGYVGRPFKIEAVLANENILHPGTYPVRMRITGPAGVVWERSLTFTIPESTSDDAIPLAIPVLAEEVTIDEGAGAYCFAASIEKGAAPAGGRLQFRLADSPVFSETQRRVTLLGMEEDAEAWLRAHGVVCSYFGQGAEQRGEVIVVGDLSRFAFELADWQELAQRVVAGAVAIFLVPSAFKRGDDAVGWLPRANKGRCFEHRNWLYHREDVAKKHPIFQGLQAGGIMDWDYYQQVIPRYLFDGQDMPDDVAAAGFGVGVGASGYLSGVLACSYAFGSGRYVLNTLRILENLDSNPAADRLFLNMIDYAASLVKEGATDLPANFPSLLAAINYIDQASARPSVKAIRHFSPLTFGHTT